MSQEIMPNTQKVELEIKIRLILIITAWTIASMSAPISVIEDSIEIKPERFIS